MAGYLDGKEVISNVLLMKSGAHVVEDVGPFDWAGYGLPSVAGHEFILRDRLGGIAAIITDDGILYLAGQVMEGQQGPIEPKAWDAQNPGTAFEVKWDGEVVSLIDEHGNLKLSGYLLEDGIPHALPLDDPDDKYFRG